MLKHERQQYEVRGRHALRVAEGHLVDSLKQYAERVDEIVVDLLDMIDARDAKILELAVELQALHEGRKA